MSIAEFVRGDTVQLVWVNTGVTPSSIISAIYNGSEILVDSGVMTSSGNGHFYRYYTTNSAGFYVAKTTATISGNPFVNGIKFKVREFQVD